jgi:hypothetical protein
MLVWMNCSDGRQTAPFQDGRRIVEIGGWYQIDPEAGCFRVSYYPAVRATP